ncbi:MAG: hypothetical protein A2044_04965 [Candidatus Firestonebacteria bacterium GWA2_43_8]|nr:MAG: hypothetical protein A2044_04965 [Candidatus Firestonebacteria bacterium GWA2_43_8]
MPGILTREKNRVPTKGGAPLDSSCERKLFIIRGFSIHGLTPVVFKTAGTIKERCAMIGKYYFDRKLK